MTTGRVSRSTRPGWGWLVGYGRAEEVAAISELVFDVPLYTVADAARILGVPTSTMAGWAKGYTKRLPDGRRISGRPVVTCHEPAGGAASIPFVGLAEALVLTAFRRSGVPLQRIRPALAELERHIGLDHALASRALYTDGAEVLYDYGEHHRGTEAGRSALQLVVVTSGQRVFVPVISDYLQRIEYGDEGFPVLIRVPGYEQARVVADPTRSFGAPIFERGGARVEDVLERFWAGDSIRELTAEFGVPADQVEDLVRVASRRAA